MLFNQHNSNNKVQESSIYRNVVLADRIDNLVVQLVITEEWNNEMTNKLTISDLPRLESIIVKKKSCIHVNSLIITNNQNLKEICFEKGDAWNGVSFNAAFENTQSFILSEYDIDLPHLEKLIIEDYAFSNTKVIELIGTSIFLI